LLNAASAPATGADGISGTFYLINAANTTQKKMFNGNCVSNSGGTAVAHICYGFWNGGNGAITGLNFLASAGNITGTIKIYGVT
jgi:hypothetical protein